MARHHERRRVVLTFTTQHQYQAAINIVFATLIAVPVHIIKNSIRTIDKNIYRDCLAIHHHHNIIVAMREFGDYPMIAHIIHKQCRRRNHDHKEKHTGGRQPPSESRVSLISHCRVLYHIRLPSVSRQGEGGWLVILWFVGFSHKEHKEHRESL